MASSSSSVAMPFIAHVRELKRRVLWSVGAIILGAAAGWELSDHLLRVLQKPLGQTLFYTSPAGGFSFIIKLSLFFGIIVGLPVVMYHTAQFLRPLMQQLTRRSLSYFMIWSLILAAAGVGFAYFISLPAALHFLTNFGNKDIQSLITADSYFNFAITYLGGFALLFQVPLIILFINRIKPLKPNKLMKAQRYVVLGSVIVAAVLTPTPDPFNQMIMALPIILLYQVGIIAVWIVNGRDNRKAARAERRAANYPAEAPVFVMPQQPAPSPAPVPLTRRPATYAARPTRTFMDILPSAPRVASVTARTTASVNVPAVRPERPGRLFSDMVTS